MANKKAKGISYVLPLAKSTGGHRLGVNGLAVDSDHSILYSGGRDGAICAWNLNLNLKAVNFSDPPTVDPTSISDAHTPAPACTATSISTFRAQTEAHTHWVNDIVLAQNNTALVSASSDFTVRVWRPLSHESEAPQTIGQHTDYVKCLTTPNSHADWVASGGLDRRVRLWDLNGAGKKLEIEVGDEEKSEKGSVYALTTSHSILASGGPESIVRLWDPRTGKRITKFVGHTDNIRDILINQNGDTIMTASSDQTVKVWSVTAGRCIHTLTMHNDSVWSLYSDDPDLGIFYSSDRGGLVVKTDVRGTHGEMDNGLSIAIAQENDGVNKVIVCQNHIWTATSSSSINRWANLDTGADMQLSDVFRNHRTGAVSQTTHLSSSITSGRARKEITAQSILRISDTATFPTLTGRESDVPTASSSSNGARKELEIIDSQMGLIMPVYALPEETIEGQHGLVKHRLLNDRRRVLTLDTTGEVLLWDLLHCIPIRSFGKRHLEDVEPEVNTLEAVAPWCSINTRTGRLAVVLEENDCFDAEMYADELQLDEAIEFREDQRINLGKWILRHIFSSLIDEVMKRDEDFRKNLTSRSAHVPMLPMSIQAPSLTGSVDSMNFTVTPRANGNSLSSGDYFCSTLISPDSSAKTTTTAGDTQHDDKSAVSLNDSENCGAFKESNTLFGKKFRMGMPFGTKKNRSVSSATEKPVTVDEKIEDGSETSESGEKEKEVDDSFGGVVQKIRAEYEKLLQENPHQQLESGITPSLLSETPLLKPPPLTTVIIQEETDGGSVDLYVGTLATVGEDATLFEERAPKWIGDLLLKNKIPLKEPVKVSFVLQPWQDMLPSIAGPDGNSRLNANKLLRVKKILAYVAERIDPAPENSNQNTLKPEEYLDLYCYDQKLPINMTLATLRALVWKGGADVMLYYKSNGRKPILHENVPEALQAIKTSVVTETSTK